MNKRRRSALNLISAVLGQALGIAIGFLLPWLFITSFGSEINGLISSANQILVYLALFEAGVGAVSLQALYGPIARGEQGAISSILSATREHYDRASLLILAGLTAVAALYPLVVTVALPHLKVSLIIFLVGLPMVVSFRVQAKLVVLLKADGKNYVVTNLTTLITLLTGTAKVLMIARGYDVLAVILVQCLIQLAQAIVIDRYTRKHYPWLDLAAEPDYPAISQKNYMLVHQVSALVFQNTDIIILTVVAGLKVVSVYAIYKMVMSQMGNLLYMLQSSVDFVLGQTFHTDRKLYIRRIDQFEPWFSGLAFSLYAVLFHLLFAFVSLYTKGVEDIQYADQWLVALFVLIELLTVARMVMLQTINYAGHFKETMGRSIFETVINLTVSLALVGWLGIYGVLIGTAVALLYRTNDIIIYANRVLLDRSPRRSFLVHLLNALVFVAVQLLFRAVFGPVDSWIKLIWTGVLVALIAMPAFFFAQTLAWPETRGTFLYYLRNADSYFKRFLRGKPSGMKHG